MFKTKVKDIMTKSVKTVSKDDTIFEVATLMKEYDIGFIPVMDNDKVVGVITDRDIVIRALSNKENYDSKVDKYITSKIVTIKQDISVDEASKIMAKQQLKRLLVMSKDKLVGVLSLSDITNNYDKKALEALKGINKRHNKNYSNDNVRVDDFPL